MEHLVQRPERQVEVRLAHDHDDQEVEPARDELQHRQGQQLHQVLGLLLEPLVLRLERVDRPAPVLRVRSRGRPHGTHAFHRLPARMARSAGVPNRPNRNHVMPRTPTHPSRASPRVPTIPNWNPCWASHGVMASISSRYKKSTSNRATANSTSTIDTICPTARVLIASFSTWMQAKLPPMMMNRKNHRSTTRASAFTWQPVKSESSSLIVGSSVNVKIVASMADPNSSSMKA